MAKKRSVNKSQAIREALQAHPNKSPKEIAELLQGQGVKVTAQYVSMIKSASKKSKRTVRRRLPSAKPAQHPVQATVEFVRSVGGFAEARQLLDALEQARSL